MLAYGNNSRKRTALLTDTFSNLGINYLLGACSMTNARDPLETRVVDSEGDYEMIAFKFENRGHIKKY